MSCTLSAWIIAAHAGTAIPFPNEARTIRVASDIVARRTPSSLSRTELAPPQALAAHSRPNSCTMPAATAEALVSCLPVGGGLGMVRAVLSPILPIIASESVTEAMDPAAGLSESATSDAKSGYPRRRARALRYDCER